MSKIILITGASSGIGEGAAKGLALSGHTVILGARRLDRLKSVAKEIEVRGGTARVHRLDVTSRENFRKVVNATIQEFGHIDALINNAGIMPLSPLSAGKVDEWDCMIDVNIKGVLNGIEAVQSHMEAREQGHIVYVASIAAHTVFPTSAVYCATKYAVWAISTGLRLESKQLRVTTICPGVVESELANTTTDQETKDWLNDFRTVAITPDAISSAILYAIEQPNDVNVNEIIVQPTKAEY